MVRLKVRTGKKIEGRETFISMGFKFRAGGI